MIALNAPSLGALEEQYVLDALRSGWVTGGAYVERFEQALGRLTGRRHVIACSSGTSALYLALRALNPKAPVLVPAYTCDAVGNAALVATGIQPTIVDVEADTFGLPWDAMARRLVGAVILAHCYGVPARDSLAIEQSCASAGVPLIEDASEAHGARFSDGRPAGGLGPIAIMSFRGEKAVQEDEVLLTPTGFVKAKDIRVGDALIAADGTQTLVEAVFPQPEAPLWSVLFSDGTRLVTTGDHRWTVEYRGTKNRLCRRVVTTNQIANRQGRVWAVPLMSRPAQLVPRAIPLPPYLLGLLLGDGCFTTKVITLASADPDIVAAAKDEAAALHADLRKHKGRNYSYAFKPHDRAMNVILWALRSRLRSRLGLWGHKSHEKFIPEDYLWNSPDVRHAVLQGLMDTDGTVGKNGSVSFSTTSPALADGFEFLVHSLGGMTGRHRAQTYYRYHGECQRARPSWDITVYLPDHIVPFRLPRKLARLRARQKNRTRRVLGADPVGVGRSVCFVVSHPDHLFVAGQGLILTHNTVSGGQLGAVLTDDAALARRVHQWAHNGLPCDTVRYWATVAGLNMQPAHLNAALACAQLERLDELVAKRNAVHARWVALFRERLGDGSERIFQASGPHTPAWWLTAIRLDGWTRILPQDLGTALEARGIQTRPGFYALGMFPHMAARAACPVAEGLLHSLLILPSGPGITPEQQDEVATEIGFVTGAW